MTAKELRAKYFQFFQDKGHKLIPSASLIPENDPTVLFTTAGMHPLTPYLLGETHPAGRRLVNAQKCARTGDIESVGDSTHLTFFEMLGNWSLGDPDAHDGIGAGYFKKEAIEWSWEFLTDKKWLGINPEQLFVTVYDGDESVPRDEESIKLWQEQFKKAGIDAIVGSRIFALAREDNWWGPAGKVGPCGPDTEMFFDTGKEKCEVDCKPGCGCGKFVEIWNDVFMEYNKQADGTYEPLKQKNVDTGMGVERTVAVLNGLESVFEIDTLAPILERIGELIVVSSGARDPLYYERSISGLSPSVARGDLGVETTKSVRIIVDHIRAGVMLASDGVLPSNVEQGYVLRRLIRRAVRHGRQLGIKENFLAKLAPTVIDIFKEIYPSVFEKQNEIIATIRAEEEKFRQTLSQGLEKFSQLVASEKMGDQIINGYDAFNLFSTYGFPLEITQELAHERGLVVDEKGFYEEFNKHQELSRAGAEQKFAGGLADHSEMAAKYHTATHLLHAALRQILGNHVEQKGSNITAERLRFDFSHTAKMSPEELGKVESLVNHVIQSNYPVSLQEMTVDEAKKSGAIGLFSEKYGEKVKVYTIGDPELLPGLDNESLPFSREICGGPHAENTQVLGKFKIIKEEAVASGIRRIKAVLE